jgi:hypothetical protein
MQLDLTILVTALMAGYTVKVSLPLIRRLSAAAVVAWQHHAFRRLVGLSITVSLAVGHMMYYPVELYGKAFGLH